MLAQYAMFQKIVSVASQFAPRALAEMKPLGFMKKKVFSGQSQVNNRGHNFLDSYTYCFCIKCMKINKCLFVNQHC